MLAPWVLALKVPKNNEVLVDVAAVTAEIQEDDQRGANQALLDIAEKGGKRYVALVLALLATQGVDPNMLQEWMSRHTSTIPKSLRLTRKAAELLLDDFQNLLTAIKSRDPASTKKQIVAIASRGGQELIARNLRGLEVLGYNPKELQEWMQNPLRTLSETTGPLIVESSWNMFLLIKAIQSANKSDVKRVLAKTLEGGQVEMKQVLERFACTGYDYASLLHWVQSDDGMQMTEGLQEEPKPKPELSRITGQDKLPKPGGNLTQTMGTQLENTLGRLDPKNFAVLTQGLENSNWAAVKDALAVFSTVGQLPKVFQKLRSMHYDLEAIKLWYQSGGSYKLQPQDSTQARSPSSQLGSVVSVKPIQSGYTVNAASEDANAKDTLMLARGVVDSDKEMAKTALRDLLHHGGQKKIEEALGHLQSLGFRAAEVERWLGDDSQSAMVNQVADSVNPAASPAEAAQNSPGRRQPKTSPQATQGAASTELDTAPELMAGAVRTGDRQAAREVLTRIFSTGGQGGLEKALLKFQSMGFDPNEFQNWVAGADIRSNKPQPPTLSREPAAPPAEHKHAAQKMAAATLGHVNATSSNKTNQSSQGSSALLRSVQQANKAETIRLLVPILKRGGAEEVEHAIQTLEVAGYNNAEVQRWLTGGGPPQLRVS